MRQVFLLHSWLASNDFVVTSHGPHMERLRRMIIVESLQWHLPSSKHFHHHLSRNAFVGNLASRASLLQDKCNDAHHSRKHRNLGQDAK